MLENPIKTSENPIKTPLISSLKKVNTLDVYQQQVSEAVAAQQKVRMDISPGKVSESGRKL